MRASGKVSSEWVKAGKVWRGYCVDFLFSGSGTGRELKRKSEPVSSEPVSTGRETSRVSVSDFITRATMRELCLIAHDCGLVEVSHAELARRLGVSYDRIKRAIKRLESDGYLYRIKRGSGAPTNRALTGARVREKAPNVYLLARLSDEYGYKLPTPAYLESALLRYSRSPRFAYLSEAFRKKLLEVAFDWHDLAEVQKPH